MIIVQWIIRAGLLLWFTRIVIRLIRAMLDELK